MSTGILLQLGTVAGSLMGMPQLLGRSSTWWMIYASEAVVLLVVLAVGLTLEESLRIDTNFSFCPSCMKLQGTSHIETRSELSFADI